MRGEKKFQYLLPRHDGEASCYASLTIHMQKALKDTPEGSAYQKAFAALKRAIDDWSRNTVLGRKMREYSSEYTNIGDMAGWLEPLDKTLRPFVRLQGIERLEVTIYADCQILPYDTLLITTD